ncbi:MAG: hypothetical protein ACPL0B_01345, partial [Anaerolineales bacterium]
MIASLFIIMNCAFPYTKKFTLLQQPQITSTIIPTNIINSPTIPPTDTPQPTFTITPNRTATNISKGATAAAILTQTAQPMNDLVSYLM